MRAAGLFLVLLGLAIPTDASAQGRRGDSQGIPPGHLPPPGECRVWYDGRPPGQQPPPTDCRTAESVARRDPYARVVYGDYREGRDSERGRGRGRAVPRSPYPPYPNETPYPERHPSYPDDRYPTGGYDDRHAGWDAGYRDGVEKGREDAVKNRRYEPNRHQWYRAGTRGYDRRYGSKDEYINVYREAFTSGYAAGFRHR
jgi:hypothetical protein